MSIRVEGNQIGRPGLVQRPVEDPLDHHTTLVQQSAYQVHDAAFANFFAVISPWNLAKKLTYKTISLLTTAVYDSAEYLFVLTKDAVLSTHAIFLDLYGQFLASDSVAYYLQRFLQCNIRENAIYDKVALLHQEITLKTGSAVYSEVVRVLTEIAFFYVKELVVHADTFAPELRPEWVQTALLHGKDFTLTGKLAKGLMEANERLFKAYLECNILKLLGAIRDHLQKVQSQPKLQTQGQNQGQNQDQDTPHFPLLDFLTDLLTRGAAHFHDVVQDAVQNAPVVDKTTPELEKSFYKALAEALLPIGLPHGAEDFELPVSKTVGSYLSAYLYDKIKSEVLPRIFEDLFALLRTKECKNLIFLEGLNALHTLIDEEHVEQETGVPVQYESVDQLSMAIRDLLKNFLEFSKLDSTTFNWIVTSFAPQRVGKKAAEALCKKLEKVSVQQLLLLAHKALLEGINPGGAWEDDHFKEAPVQIVKTAQEQQLAEQAKREKVAVVDAKIATLLQTIGKDPKGLVLAAKSQIYAAPGPENQTASTASHWSVTAVARSIGRGLVQGYRLASHGVVKGSLALADVPARINSLAATTVEKLKAPRHELIFFDVADSVVHIIAHKKALPDVRASYTIENHPT